MLRELFILIPHSEPQKSPYPVDLHRCPVSSHCSGALHCPEVRKNGL